MAVQKPTRNRLARSANSMGFQKRAAKATLFLAHRGGTPR